MASFVTYMYLEKQDVLSLVDRRSGALFWKMANSLHSQARAQIVDGSISINHMLYYAKPLFSLAMLFWTWKRSIWSQLRGHKELGHILTGCLNIAQLGILDEPVADEQHQLPRDSPPKKHISMRLFSRQDLEDLPTITNIVGCSTAPPNGVNVGACWTFRNRLKLVIGGATVDVTREDLISHMRLTFDILLSALDA